MTEVAICIILVLLNTAVSLKDKEQIISTSTTSGAVTAYTSRAHEFTPGFKWGSCYSIFSFMCMFCRSLFFLLSFLLLAIVLSVLLRFTDYDYPFDIIKLFFLTKLVEIYMLLLIPLWYLQNLHILI